MNFEKLKPWNWFKHEEGDSGEQQVPVVRVVNIAADSTPAFSGSRPGDVIVGVNKRRVRDLKTFYAAVARNATSVLLQINRNGGSFFGVIR